MKLLLVWLEKRVERESMVMGVLEKVPERKKLQKVRNKLFR